MYWWDHPTGFTVVQVAKAILDKANEKNKAAKFIWANYTLKVTIPGIAISTECKIT